LPNGCSACRFGWSEQTLQPVEIRNRKNELGWIQPSASPATDALHLDGVPYTDTPRAPLLQLSKYLLPNRTCIFLATTASTHTVAIRSTCHVASVRHRMSYSRGPRMHCYTTPALSRSCTAPSLRNDGDLVQQHGYRLPKRQDKDDRRTPGSTTAMVSSADALPRGGRSRRSTSRAMLCDIEGADDVGLTQVWRRH